MSKQEKVNINPNLAENSKKDNISNREKLTVMTGKNYDIVDISLPNNFFEQIFLNEVALSQEFKYEKLSSLVQLYLNAIQYYSSVQPEKVKAYQNRLEFLLTQKETLQNLCKMKSESEKKSKSSKQLQRVRGSVKTKFLIQSDNIKKEDIAKKVKIVMNETTNVKEKENKNNIKNLINNEFESQSKKWKEKLNLKRSQMGSRPRLRTSYCGRNFYTPGPITRRSLNIENKVDMNKFEKSGKNIPKFGNIDDDESELDDNKSQNEGEPDFLKMFKERHNKEAKKDSDDEGSIIDDNYENEDILMKIEEVDEEEKDDKIKKSEKNVIKNLENKDDNDNKKELSDKKPLKGILKKKEGENKDNDEKKEDNEENKEKDEKKENIEKKDNEEIKDNNEENKEKIENSENKKENEEKKEEKEDQKEEIKKEENTEEKKEEKENQEEDKKKEEEKKEEKEDKKEEEKKEENEVKKEEENNKDKTNEENKEVTIKEEKNDNEDENDGLGAKNIIHEDGDNILKEKPFQRKKSIVDENILKDMEPDDEIKKIIEEKMEILNKLKEENNSGDESAHQSSSSLPIVSKKVDIEEIPPVFQETFIAVEEKMKEFIGKLNNHFYNDAFEEYSLKLKELYDSKYKKYIDVNNEYYSSIKEKEFLLDNEEDLSEEKKAEIKNIIDSLHEEQKDQIDKIIDEYNNNIILSMNEFKQNSFRKNVGLQLLEEQLKLDIYTMINEAYYY